MDLCTKQRPGPCHLPLSPVRSMSPVYISSTADRTEKVFNLLSQQHVVPPDEPHLFMGDFNAHTHSCTEEHVTSSDDIPVRIGDEHVPAGPGMCLSGASLSSAQRVRLLLTLLKIEEYVLLNGRFQRRSDSTIPYTCARTPHRLPLLITSV